MERTFVGNATVPQNLWNMVQQNTGFRAHLELLSEVKEQPVWHPLSSYVINTYPVREAFITCSICREEDNLHIPTSCKRLPCFHEFHTTCIDLWLSINSVCPECRHELRPIQATKII
jgi:hypothetical protein